MSVKESAEPISCGARERRKKTEIEASLCWWRSAQDVPAQDAGGLTRTGGGRVSGRGRAEDPHIFVVHFVRVRAALKKELEALKAAVPGRIDEGRDLRKRVRKGGRRRGTAQL